MFSIGILVRTCGVSKILVGVSLRKHFLPTLLSQKWRKLILNGSKMRVFSCGMMHPNRTEPDKL